MDIPVCRDHLRLAQTLPEKACDFSRHHIADHLTAPQSSTAQLHEGRAHKRQKRTFTECRECDIQYAHGCQPSDCSYTQRQLHHSGHQRFRGGPETVRQTIIDSVAEDDAEYGRMTVSLPQSPGSAGQYVIADLTRVLAGHLIHSSPESGDKYTRAMPVAAIVNGSSVSIIKGPYLKAF